MLVTLEEVKNYLRVDTDEDDELISGLIITSQCICQGLLKAEDIEKIEAGREQVKTAVLYGTAYLYEHREKADHHGMIATLRALLSPLRKVDF